MKHFIRRGAALGLALALTVTAASASYALGWDVHTAQVPLSQGATLGKNIFWSDSYSDLRHEYYISYSPNENVVPTVAYGDKVLNRQSLSTMAKGLENQGKRVVSGINGDWYVLSTGSTVGLLVTDGVVRATPYHNTAWAVGFYEDGTAFFDLPIVLFGDLNGDGAITAEDVTSLQNHLIRASLLTGPRLRAADVNHDGEVDLQDLFRLIQYVNGDAKISQED